MRLIMFFFQMDVTLTFWKDGFSLDDGPLRDFNDPANKPFLASIQKG
jgi:UBX domain-containing protein 1